VPDIFLSGGEPNPSDIRLRDPLVAPSGGGSVSGTVAVTETIAAASSVQVLKISAPSAVTQSAATSASVSALKIQSSSAVSESVATSSAVGSLKFSGSSSVQQASATSSSSETLRIAGTVSPSQTAATSSNSQTEKITASSAQTQTASTSSATTPPSGNTVDVTQSASTSSAEATVTVTAPPRLIGGSGRSRKRLRVEDVIIPKVSGSASCIGATWTASAQSSMRIASGVSALLPRSRASAKHLLRIKSGVTIQTAFTECRASGMHDDDMETASVAAAMLLMLPQSTGLKNR